MATYKIVDTGQLDILNDAGEWITRVHICGGDTAKMTHEAMQELADFAESLPRRMHLKNTPTRGPQP
ncbi:MAG: hypothetical protein HEQ38_17205 [Gemmatimonas sp.]|nr:hypothetical protein [Gemmatimonas sp.]